MRAIKLLTLTVCMVVLAVFSAVSPLRAGVYINDVNEDISIHEGAPLNVPFFFVFSDKPTELFIWREALDTSDRKYFDETGNWRSFSSLEEIRPFLPLRGIEASSPYKYLRFGWPFSDNTSGWKSFDLVFCMDENVDGKLVQQDPSICATKRINIIPVTENNCSGLSVSNENIVKTLTAGAQPATEQISVSNSCGPANFTAAVTTNNSSLVSLSTQAGLLIITYNASSPTVGTAMIKIKIVSGKEEKEITLNYTVNASCNSLSLSTQQVTETVAKGASKNVNVSVNSCGVDFTAVSDKSWIKTTKQSGGLVVTLDASALKEGAYTGKITLASSAGNASIDVALTVTKSSGTLGGNPFSGGSPFGGTCTAKSAKMTPEAVNLTIKQGEIPQPIEVMVTDNCGKVISFTNATVTSGNSWLGVSPRSGNGQIVVTMTNTDRLPAGTSNGAISISPSGYPAVTLSVTLNIGGPCVSSSALISPSSITASAAIGSKSASGTATIKDNCGVSIPYTVTNVIQDTTAFIASPLIGDTGSAGSLAVRFNIAALSAGNYRGSIELNLGNYGLKSIPVSLNVSAAPAPGTVSTTATLLHNYYLVYSSYKPGDVKYFYFLENSNKGLGNTRPVIVSQMDMTANTYNDIDMIVKYAGPNCELGKPTMEEYRLIKSRQMTAAQAKTNNLYSRISSDAFETVEIKAPNPEGCYYVMVINASNVSEPKISLKYEDADTIPVTTLP